MMHDKMRKIFLKICCRCDKQFQDEDEYKKHVAMCGRKMPPPPPKTVVAPADKTPIVSIPRGGEGFIDYDAAASLEPVADDVPEPEDIVDADDPAEGFVDEPEPSLENVKELLGVTKNIGVEAHKRRRKTNGVKFGHGDVPAKQG